MFFILSQLISWVIMPITQIILAVLATMLVRRRYLKSMRLVAIVLIFFYTSPLTSWIGTQIWEVPATPFEELEGTYDIGIVLGGMTNLHYDPADRPHFNQNADRITDALTLYKKGTIKKLLLSGGAGYLGFPELNESDRLKEFAQIMGVNEEDLIIENRSQNTRENALYTMELIQKEYPNSSLLLITSGTHMRRAKACFQKVGANPTSFSSDINSSNELVWSLQLIIPNVGALFSWTRLLNEWVGYLVYWMIGYL